MPRRIRPLGDRPGLALAPDELAVDRAVVVARPAAVPGGDHVVEARAPRPAAGSGPRGWSWPSPAYDPARGARRSPVARTAAPRRPAVLRHVPLLLDTRSTDHPRAARAPWRVTSIDGQVSPMRLNTPNATRLQRARRSAEQPHMPQRLADDRSACSGQQRAIQVEDRRARRRRWSSTSGVSPVVWPCADAIAARSPSGRAPSPTTPQHWGGRASPGDDRAKRLKDWRGAPVLQHCAAGSGGGDPAAAARAGPGGCPHARRVL